jgi:hypothetical protein
MIPLIFKLNARYIIEYSYLLPNLPYMFPYVLHHPRGELRITCSKLSAFYKVVTLVELQNVKCSICKFYNVIYNY